MAPASDNHGSILLGSTSVQAELRRCSHAGEWPDPAETISADGVLRLGSFGFACAPRAVYRTTDLL